MADSIIIDLDIDNGKAKISLNEFEDKSKKTSKKVSKNFKRAFASVGTSVARAAKSFALIGSAAATVTGALLFKKSIEAANKQEDAINQLNSALQISGKFSKEASLDLQRYASSLQETTKFGDETILSTQALIQSLGNLSKDQLKDATKATLDLASALRIDLNAAAVLVGKAAAGEIGSFSRYGVIIKKGADNAQTFANALDALNKKFGGAAAKEVNTFSGATAQLSNTFGDLLEKFGLAVTQNPLIINVVKVLNKAFQELQLVFESNKDAVTGLVNSGFKSIITASIGVTKGLANIVAGFNALSNIAAENKAVERLEDLNDKLLLARQLTSQVSIIPGSDRPKSITEMALEADIAAEEKRLELRRKQTVDEQAFFDGLIDGLKNTQAEITNVSLENSKAIGEEVNNQAITTSESLMTLSDVFTNVGTSLTSGVTDATGNAITKIEELNKRLKAFAAESGKALQKGFAQSAGNAFAEFGRAAASGENALEAFGKALLKSIGQQAVTLGTKFILEGTAYLFSPGFQALGPPLIAAGAGLAAFGGVLGAVSGGGSSSSQGGSPTGAFAADSFEPESETASPDNIQDRGPNNQIIVQGSIVDPQGILDAVNQISEENGAVLSGVSFA